MKEKAAVVGVVGAGQMGSGIGQVFATAGYRVKLYDISTGILGKASARIAESLKKLESKEMLDKPSDLILNLISYHSDVRDLADCSICMESAFENFDVKTNILYGLAEIIDRRAHIASNTSSYSITSLSRMLPHPDRFIGFHFMNPPPLMELVEIIRGHYTSDATFAFFWKLAEKLGKVPIASKNSPGFLLNRVLIPMINEAIYALYEGISTADQIDAALKLGANHPIGPLALADLIGLDTVLAILKTLQKELGENKYSPCPLLEDYVSRGHLGKKVARGFFQY
jgi:3-hydroxybutyryl-CoA dehydrogenase